MPSDADSIGTRVKVNFLPQDRRPKSAAFGRHTPLRGALAVVCRFPRKSVNTDADRSRHSELLGLRHVEKADIFMQSIFML
jgi:hypothetical protein